MFSKSLCKIALFSLILTLSIPTFAKAESLEISMLNFTVYEKMPKELQKEYIHNIRKTWMAFESKYPATMKKNAQFWQRLFIETAEAADGSCIICGTRLDTVNGSCPTRGKPCNDTDNPNFDGFRCGPIFGEVCISRTPVSNISERGFKEAFTKIADKKEYENMVKTLAMDFAELCKSTSASNTRDGCKFLAKRMTKVSEELNIKIAALEKYNKNPIPELEPTNSETADSEVASAPAKEEEGPTSNAGAARAKRTAASAQAHVCAPGKTGRKGKSLVPKFDLLAGNTCGFDNNQHLVENLATNGCGVTQKGLFSTEIRALSGRVDGQTSLLKTIVTKVELLDRKSDTDATFNLRMLKYDLSKNPVQLTQITRKVRQNGDKYSIFNAWGGEKSVTIENSNREFLKFTDMEGLKTMIDAGSRLATDCLLLEDIKTMQANGTSITPSLGAGGTRSNTAK